MLRTVDEVLEAIGRERFYALTGKDAGNAWDYKSRGKFPPQLYVLMTAELKRINCRAPMDLWSMVNPKDANAA